MQVVILCGGKGTRLGQESEVRPKPLVTIGDKPILWHIMKHYARFGHKDFILCLGYKGEMIKDYFLNYETLENDFTLELGSSVIAYHSRHDEKGWRITMANTGLEAQTGARVKKIAKYIQGNEFMLTYGDGVSDIDIERLVKYHRSHGKAATVCAVHPPARFGEITLDDGKVRSFAEKPQVSAGLINGGFFVLNRKVFDYIPEGDACIFEHEPMVRLAQDGQLMAYEHEGFWQCVDTIRELNFLRELWDSGKARWKTW